MRQTLSAAEIEEWLVDYLANLLNAPSSQIDPEEPFTSLGVSSAEAVILTGDIETWLGIRLDPTLAWEHPSIRATARHLAEQVTIHRRGTIA
jgi:acyl carrier protein